MGSGRLDIAPPPMRIGGILMAFDVSGERNCSFSRAAQSPQEMDARRAQIKSQLESLKVFSEEELEVGTDLAQALMSDSLYNVLAMTQKFSYDAHRLVTIRDKVGQFLNGIEECAVEILPTKPFRIMIEGVQTDAVHIALKDKNSNLVIVIASDKSLPSEVFGLIYHPDGKTEMEAKPMFDPAQLFRSINNFNREKKLVKTQVVPIPYS